MPQAPQLFESDCKLTQALSHWTLSLSQEQAPATQVRLEGHLLPQAPQLSGSVAIVVQPVLQASGLVQGQLQLPLEQF